MAPYINKVEATHVTQEQSPQDLNGPITYPWKRNATLAFGNRSFLSTGAAVHNSKLWLMFVNDDYRLMYGSGNNENFDYIKPVDVIAQRPTYSPALCDVAGVLHCVFPGNSPSTGELPFEPSSALLNMKIEDLFIVKTFEEVRANPSTNRDPCSHGVE